MQLNPKQAAALIAIGIGIIIFLIANLVLSYLSYAQQLSTADVEGILNGFELDPFEE